MVTCDFFIPIVLLVLLWSDYRVHVNAATVADETYHSCVIGKLDDVVGAELGSAVVGQQREEQWAEHTALWSTCAQCGSDRGVVADTDWLRSSG